MPHLAPAILILEKRPRREADLKRAFAGEPWLIRPCRSSADLLELCRLMPGSIVLIDLDAGVPAALRCLEQIGRLRLSHQEILVSTPHLNDLEWTLRDLGAMAVLPETVGRTELATACRRFLAEPVTIDSEP